MKHMSDCFDCCICADGNGGCLAGIGDNDFLLASKEELIRRLDDAVYENESKINQIKETLKTEYHYDYDIGIIGNRYGNKSVIKQIVPQHLMPCTDNNNNSIMPIILRGLSDAYKEFEEEGDK